MYKIGNKIKIHSKNEDADGKDFTLYTIITGISEDIDGKTKYIVGTNAINPEITRKCTEEEITNFYI